MFMEAQSRVTLEEFLHLINSDCSRLTLALDAHLNASTLATITSLKRILGSDVFMVCMNQRKDYSSTTGHQKTWLLSKTDCPLSFWYRRGRNRERTVSKLLHDTEVYVSTTDVRTKQSEITKGSLTKTRVWQENESALINCLWRLWGNDGLLL